MDAYLETVGSQMIEQLTRHSVIAFGNEIEGGVESELHLELHQLSAPGEPFRALHIVRKDERKPLSLGPAGPSFGRPFGAGKNRPFIQHALALAQSKPAPDRHPYGCRQQGLNAVIKTVTKHGRENL